MFRPVKIWLSINVPMIGFSILNHKIFNYISTYLPYFLSTPIYFASELTKNIMLIKIMNTNKPLITDRVTPSLTKPSIMINLAMTSLIKTITQNVISAYIITDNRNYFSKDAASDPTEFVYLGMIMMTVFHFFYKSFLFELIFDFYHYSFHRLVHAHPILYRHIHKQHHQYHEPTATTAFYMSAPDLIMTHCIPLFLTVILLSLNQYTSISRLDFMLINTYLSYQEVGGHLGRWMNPTSSFAQFIWIPKWLNIELYTEDHDLHHSQSRYNYSKRFSLWDKLFGTFKKSCRS
jgi:sterol desaturase/sphingolipid hydroxylase (fatty acid hydroxylase superfamily)